MNHVLLGTQGPREFKGCVAGQSNRRQKGFGVQFQRAHPKHAKP